MTLEELGEMTNEIYDMNLKMDFEIKNAVWDKGKVNNKGHIISLWRRDNVFNHTAFAIFENDKGMFKYSIYELHGMYFTNCNKGERNRSMILAYILMHCMVDESICKDLAVRRYVTDDYKRDLGIKMVEVKVVSDTDVFDTYSAIDNNKDRWVLPEFKFEALALEENTDSE